MVREKDGKKFKFLGDAPVAVAAWFKYLSVKGAALAGGSYYCSGLQVHV